jgi:uncharacterized protein YkwD
MKTHQYTRVIAVACAVALASCASPHAPTRIAVSAPMNPDASHPSRLLHEVNSYRSTKGESALQRHPGLDRLAQEHCEYLRQNRGTFKLNGKNVSHFGFDGRALVARERYRMDHVSENVAAANHPGRNPAPLMVELWKGSKDHHKNMLEDWTHTGIGVVVDSDGMVFATQLFSTVSNSQMTTRERFNRF